MAHPEFVVPVEDLRSGEKERRWPLSAQWLTTILAGTTARPTGDGALAVQLSLNGRQVVVRGTARAPVEMPCARTLEPVAVDVSADIFLLLSPTSPAATPKPGSGKKGRRRGRQGKAEPDSATPLSDEDAAEDTYDGERVVLDDFVREFILLELPMVPLRSDLRSDSTTTIEAGDTAAERPVDPRLAPLAAIASRLRQTKE